MSPPVKMEKPLWFNLGYNEQGCSISKKKSDAPVVNRAHIIMTLFTTLSEWKLFRFDKYWVNDFEILLIDV